MSDDKKDNYMLGIIMAQYSIKAGLKIFEIKGKKLSLINFHISMIWKLSSLCIPKKLQKKN